MNRIVAHNDGRLLLGGRVVQYVYEPKYLLLRNARIQHFDRILYWLQQPVPAKEQILASHLPLVLAYLKSGTITENSSQSKDSELVIQAKAAMLENLETHTDLKALATQLGVSYSRFRFAFKKQTGFSPREYENMIKLNRARDLLQRDSKSVTETAISLGYSSVHYFSRAFKKQFGQSPIQCQREQRR